MSQELGEEIMDEGEKQLGLKTLVIFAPNKDNGRFHHLNFIMRLARFDRREEGEKAMECNRVQFLRISPLNNRLTFSLNPSAAHHSTIPIDIDLHTHFNIQAFRFALFISFYLFSISGCARGFIMHLRWDYFLSPLDHYY